jgi:hypothetical protein
VGLRIRSSDSVQETVTGVCEHCHALSNVIKADIFFDQLNNCVLDMEGFPVCRQLQATETTEGVLWIMGMAALETITLCLAFSSA